MHIIFKSVLILLSKIIKISPCLSKLQLAKVGAFFFETVYISSAVGLHSSSLSSSHSLCHMMMICETLPKLTHKVTITVD